MAADIWKKMQTEYMRGGISYRQLAAKYGVSVSTLMKRASAEHWCDKRKQASIKSEAKTIEAISDSQAARAARLQTVTDKVLGKVEKMVESNEVLDADPSALRDITRVLKDIKDIQAVKSDLDLQEQKARIANLQRQAEKEELSKEPIQVVLGEDLEDYTG